jgi:hypothetical protein
VLPAAPLIESKGVTRATNAVSPYHTSSRVPNGFTVDRDRVPGAIPDFN